MEKRKYALFAVLLVCFLMSGGCGPARKAAEDAGPHEPISVVQEDVQTEDLTEKTAGETSAEEIQAADGGTFEYEIRELPAQRDGNQIYGVAYIPLDAGGQMPAVIYAHGYGVTHQNGIQYAERLVEHGFMVYCFDFCGGSNGSRSDGSPLEMSIFTEQADLEAVIGMIRGLDYVDRDHVFLFGASQGGLVSGITAAASQEDIQGLILLYPGFEIVEDVQALFASADEIPETYSMFGWMTVGRTYFEDLLDYDAYNVIGAYEKDVLLIHGDADGIVPISSSERALEVYPSAELFSPEPDMACTDRMRKRLQSICWSICRRIAVN